MLSPGQRHPLMSLLRSQLDQEVMIKGVKLSGRVVDAADKPIPRAHISESSEGLTFLTYNRHVETDAEGRFHFHFNPNEKVSLDHPGQGLRACHEVIRREAGHRTDRVPPRAWPGNTRPGG